MGGYPNREIAHTQAAPLATYADILKRLQVISGNHSCIKSFVHGPSVSIIALSKPQPMEPFLHYANQHRASSEL
ncbi:MAG: hypothetical protein AAF671_12510 [Pseudomonadota bacterium]